MEMYTYQVAQVQEHALVWTVTPRMSSCQTEQCTEHEVNNTILMFGNADVDQNVYG